MINLDLAYFLSFSKKNFKKKIN